MTFFSPQKKQSPLNIVIAILTFTVLLSVLGLIVLYNQMVDLKKQTTEIREEIDITEEAIAGLKEQKLMVFEGDYAKKVIKENGLVLDRRPVYLQLEKAWEFASRY